MARTKSRICTVTGMKTSENNFYKNQNHVKAVDNISFDVYPKETLAKEVSRYNREFVEQKRAFGELGHPDGPTVNLERVSHMITNLYPDGNNFIGEAKIMDTPYGKIVKNLMDG